MKYWLLVLSLIAGLASAGSNRSAAEVAAFKRLQPCPSTGLPRGSCPGHVVDHIHPLCAGGADSRHNMQWQTRADSLKKDVEERRLCRRIKAQR